LTGAEDTSQARWVALGERASVPIATPRRRRFSKYARLVVGLVSAALS
jgi:hypothetical protein